MDDYNKKNKMMSLDSVHKLIDLLQKNKNIEIGKEYFASEWSWQPVCDGIFVYPEIIRSSTIVDGIEVYFTNDNYRIYLKEDLFETEEQCKKMCDWKNSFGYDYECGIDRKRLIKDKLEYFHRLNKIMWRVKPKQKI